MKAKKQYMTPTMALHHFHVPVVMIGNASGSGFDANVSTDVDLDGDDPNAARRRNALWDDGWGE